MEMNAAAASFTWTSALIQDPNNPQNTRVVLKRVRTERLQDAQDMHWTCTLVDDPQNPRAIVRKVPVKDASPGEAPKQPQVTTGKRAVSPPPQVATRKRVAVARKKRGLTSGWMKSMQGFLQQKFICQSTCNNGIGRPKTNTCKGPKEPCHGECRQGFKCKGQRPPPAKHHFLIDGEVFANRRTCIVIDVPINRRMVRRKRPSSACVATKRPGPSQR